MRSLIAKLSLVATLVGGPLLAPCDGQVNLSWSPSSSPVLAGYYLCWGTASGVYTFTNTYPPSQTSGTVSGLAAGQVYFIAVEAFGSDGSLSPFSTEAIFTNTPSSANPGAPSAANTIFVTSSNGPPAVPGGGSSSPANNSSVVSGNGAGINSITTPTNSAANFWGVPPFLTMTVSNGQPNMNIGGTVGATLMIQTTTNPFLPDSWETVTNITLTNIAPLAQANQASQPQDVLDLAFVPATQEVPIAPSNLSPFQLFRVVMPYDYVILASITLSSQGYKPRLILVNMPGIVRDDACYVSEASSFIHYNWTNAVLALQSSRPSIRQIASTLANSLNLDWTSASEFSYSNGLGQILATVVETEPSSSDPVAGQTPPSQPMVIDF